MSNGKLTRSDGFDLDVAVIGLGRVGLPLALCFADHELRVLGIDKDPDRIRFVNDGVMPFHETGTQELLDRVQRSGRLGLSDQVADAARAEYIVLTLGTPMLPHIEIDVSQIRSVLDELLPALRQGHHIVLRSTVAPGTTDFVAGYLEQHSDFKVGTDIYIAHAPERIAENHFIEEIHTLPHIVGGVDDSSSDRVGKLMAVFGSRVVKTGPVQAELAKIWTNILRYTTFALPNMLMMQCEELGANVFEVIDLINRDYPRGGMASPGLTAGTCLRKDFAFSEEHSSAPSMLLAVSRVHETVPNFLVEGICRRVGELRNRKVTVLGLTFKRDSDDTRDSLSLKIVRLLERKLANVATHDPHAPATSESLKEVVSGADVVVAATNHTDYARPETLDLICSAAGDRCLFVDPWNVFDSAQVFAHADEVKALSNKLRAELGSRT